MQAEIISLGTELLTGAAIDTNSAWLSDRLGACGVPVRRHMTLADNRAAITSAFREACERADLVVVTGGLGPTQDDLTRAALADAMDVPLATDDASVAQIEAFFRGMNRDMPLSNRVQAECPRGASPLPNEWGTAPGIRAQLARATIFCFPGVPREMHAMFERYVTPFIAEGSSGHGIALRVLRTYGAGESHVAEKIADLMPPGRNPAVGTTASEGVISVRVVAHADSQGEAEALADADVQEVRKRLGKWVYGAGEDTLASVIGEVLAARGQTVATAESCTGGLIAKLLTDIPGSSRYFVGGVVTYSNEQKTALLNVPADMIAKHGAVSEEVAETMAANCQSKFGCDYALSITGIAGPDGGTPQKPVGLVYIGLAHPEGVIVRKMRLSQRFNRDTIRDRSAKTALNLLRKELL